MKCLYCDKEINTYTLYDLFIEQDVLCNECRKKMKYHHQKFHLDDLEVESFYDYDSLFKELLLQYKECYDEALKDVFLYRLEDYLRIKYFGYQIIYVPSCKENSERRGFNHLKEIFEKLNFHEVKEIKMKNNSSQKNKSLIGRTKMIENFEYYGKPLNKVLIVDDVFTTGSSLKGVYLAIKTNCKKCKAIVLAKT